MTSVWVNGRKGKTLDVSEYIDGSPWEGEYATFNMMIYGEPGEGKTPLLGTVVDVPSMLPALLIDCDAGTLSIREKDGLNTLHLSKMAAGLSSEGKEVTPWRALEEAYRWLSQEEHDYKTIMLDGGSEIQRYCELECIAFGIERKQSGDHDPELAELADNVCGADDESDDESDDYDELLLKHATTVEYYHNDLRARDDEVKKLEAKCADLTKKLAEKDLELKPKEASQVVKRPPSPRIADDLTWTGC